jgi:sarcosine oxidase subunit beta
VSERADVLIAGGGVVGTALAWALAERGVSGIHVIDLDLAGVYAASELNAGGARATWWQPVNIETCRATLDFFRAHAGEFGFRERGYLWLYDDADLYAQAREKRALQNAQGLGVELLAPGEVVRRFPIVDRGVDALVGATFSPRDGLVNPNAVRAWYRREAEARGVSFHDRHYIAGVRTARALGAGVALRRVAELDVVELARGEPTDASGELREVLTRHRIPPARVLRESRIACDVVVNCLGAWSPIFAAKIGVRDVTEPVRRQIALVDVHRADLAPGVSLDALGMIVDPTGLYFHPEGPHVLAGYSIPEEPPGFDFDYDGEDFFLEHVWPRLAARASSFERCGHVRGWAGLYEVTPDCSGIAGRVGGFANLFEAHAFTGRGVMQSYGVARGMAALIAAGRYEELDLSALSRERFADPARWVREDLHI